MQRKQAASVEIKKIAQLECGGWNLELELDSKQ
jgi:hypothetical protein